MDEFDKEIKRWPFLEKEFPRKMMQGTGNQKQSGMDEADDRLGNSGGWSGAGDRRQSVSSLNAQQSSLQITL